MVCLACAFGAPDAGLAAETNGLIFTNNLAIELPKAAINLTPLKRYEHELIENQGVIGDKFGPPSSLDWTRRFSREGYSIHDDINSLGTRAVTRLLGDSLRETAVGVLPIEEWKSFGSLLLGSIGNTAEERTETISVSYSQTEESWRRNVYQDGFFRYGVRPWRSDPYGYFGIRVGHWGGLENLPLFVFEGRVGYKLFNSSRLEGRLLVPLPHGLQLAGGIATDPMRLGSHATNPTVMSARLEYVFKKHREERVMYVGASSSSHETLLATGFLLAW